MSILAALTLITIFVFEQMMAKTHTPIEGIAAIGIVGISMLLYIVVVKLDDILSELRKR